MKKSVISTLVLSHLLLLAMSANTFPTGLEQAMLADITTDAVMPLDNNVVDWLVIKDAAACASIGEFCQVAEQCCSKRCLSYKARCVT